jgi:hypothetical protein
MEVSLMVGKMIMAALAPLLLQAEAPAPIASNPVVELRGTITRVNLSPGQGVPFVEIKQASGVTTVYLGAMRYLIAENFSPKAGQTITGKGYKTGDSIVAIEVTLVEEKKTLKLRDENGRPLWRGGPWGKGGRR